jgi:hypothetical protein
VDGYEAARTIRALEAKAASFKTENDEREAMIGKHEVSMPHSYTGAGDL